jgi:hypothetical protein
MLMHYFSCSGRPSVDAIKRAPGHVTSKLCFCIWCDMWLTLCARVCETSMHYFSCSGGPGADPTRSALGHVTSNCVFASGAICGSHSVFGCIQALFFLLEWARYGSRKKRTRICYAELVCFASGAICGSRSVLGWIWGVKQRHTISHARVDPLRSHETHTKTRYAEHVFLHLV